MCVCVWKGVELTIKHATTATTSSESRWLPVSTACSRVRIKGLWIYRQISGHYIVHTSICLQVKNDRIYRQNGCGHLWSSITYSCYHRLWDGIVVDKHCRTILTRNWPQPWIWSQHLSTCCLLTYAVHNTSFKTFSKHLLWFFWYIANIWL